MLCVYVLNELVEWPKSHSHAVFCMLRSKFVYAADLQVLQLSVNYLLQRWTFFLLLFINFKMISSLFGVLLLVLRLDPMKLRLTSNMVCRQEPALNFQAAVILITF